MALTVATMTTSSRSIRLDVARSRRRSMSSIDRGVLLDVDVGRRDVGLGLVVVVVRDEVFDRVLREELLELAVELGRQGLVVREDQGGLSVRRDGVRQGHRLARAGDAEQGLVLVAALEAGRRARRWPWAGRRRGQRGRRLRSGGTSSGKYNLPGFVRERGRAHGRPPPTRAPRAPRRWVRTGQARTHSACPSRGDQPVSAAQNSPNTAT